ncbi:MAG TPA: pirin family protein [Ilumatobacter sp.]|nr:pirin family protein [Ilumatobacter sp.]
MTTTEIRRADTRFHTEIDWLDSHHSFSFGPHYDANNQGHGLLLVLNDDKVRAGTGFGMHPHRDMEIVTWVLSGKLEHRDSEGNYGLIYPGLAQRMSAGTGIRHSEFNPDPDVDVHFLQMWVPPDTNGIPPGYEQKDVQELLDTGELVAVASGAGHDGAIHIHQRDAVLWVGRLAADKQVGVPAGGHVHVYVARGDGRLGDEALTTGDAARLTDVADGDVTFTAGADGTEVVIWATA